MQHTYTLTKISPALNDAKVLKLRKVIEQYVKTNLRVTHTSDKKVLVAFVVIFLFIDLFSCGRYPFM